MVGGCLHSLLLVSRISKSRVKRLAVFVLLTFHHLSNEFHKSLNSVLDTHFYTSSCHVQRKACEVQTSVCLI